MSFPRPARLIVALFGIALCASQTVVAQGTSKAEIKDVKIAAQKTPKFNVQGVKDKKWRPKTWLEIEVDFEVEVPRTKFVDEILFKYYVVLDAPSREERRTLTGEIVHQNIKVGEVAHSVAYISPASLETLTGKDDVSDSDITAWGVEILLSGQLVGGESSTGKKWWESAQVPPRRDGLILNKKQTPFAPLWGDYHADVRD